MIGNRLDLLGDFLDYSIRRWTICSGARQFGHGLMNMRSHGTDIIPPTVEGIGFPRVRQVQGHAPSANFRHGLTGGEAFYDLREYRKCAKAVNEAVSKAMGNV